MDIASEQFPGFESIHLERGGHNDRGRHLCIMEAVAWLANEAHSDRPSCVAPDIAMFARNFNDMTGMTSLSRQELLVPLVERMIGTGTHAHMADAVVKRAIAAADAAVRRIAPIALESSSFEAKEHGQKLRSLPEITDVITASVAALACDDAASLFEEEDGDAYLVLCLKAAADLARRASMAIVATDDNAKTNLGTSAVHDAAYTALRAMDAIFAVSMESRSLILRECATLLGRLCDIR